MAPTAREARETATDEIEVTPEMIEAGEEELWNSDYGSPVGLTALNTVENILTAALRSGGFHVRKPSHR